MAAWLTGSTSMLVEAAHSLADCGNLGLLVWSTPVAEPPADADYLLEHGGAIYI